MICSKTTLGSELDKMKQLLIENGYPTDVLLSCINQKLANFSAEKAFGPEKCPVYLKLPWIGNIRKKSSTVREQPRCMCKNISSKINCESAIGQLLITNPECAKTYTDDNFRNIGQARSSFHLGVLESVYIKTENPVLCRQKEFVFSVNLFN